MLFRVVLVLIPAALANAQTGLVAEIDARAPHYAKLSRQIWELAELGYQEHRSAALLKEELRGAGFSVQEGVAGMPTAFVATWGTGQPVIGLLAEYDALPGLSQDAVPRRAPRVAHGASHACGHNLLGAAAVFAAIAAKNEMGRAKLAGAIRVYGTPAEEGGGGKIYLIHAGLFRDVDAVLAWHPGDLHTASLRSCLANIQGRFRSTVYSFRDTTLFLYTGRRGCWYVPRYRLSYLQE